MTKQDREIVEQIRGEGVYGNSFTVGQVHDLIDIIDRLDTQLVEIKEAMKPVRYVVAHTDPVLDDSFLVYAGKLPSGNQYAYLELGHMRRLVESLEEVKDE